MLLLTGGWRWPMQRSKSGWRRRGGWPVARQRPQGRGQWLAVVGALLVLALVCAAPLLAIGLRALYALFWGQGAAVLLEPETLAALGNTLRFSGMALRWPLHWA
jgi:ABC-type Fe3+ transport system permease subunit